MSAVDTFRDALFGTPPSPTMKPSREGALAAFTELYDAAVVAQAAAQSNITIVATTVDRDIFFATEANRGKLVYVNNNNGSATDPANGVYEYVGGAARLAQSFYQGLAAAVQPQIDEAVDAAEAATEAATDATAAANSAAAAIPSVLALAQATARTGAGRGLYGLKRDLSDPLVQFLAVTMLCNSIGWGQTVTGMAPIEPRNGTLTDTRNNATSPSTANLLHAYVGRKYYGDATVEATAWPGSQGGVAIFTYRHTVDLFPYGGRFATTNVGGVGGWSVQANAGALTGYYLQAQVASSADNMRLAFTMTGYEFDLVHATIAEGARYELFVDGVSKGTFSTQSGDRGLPDGFGRVTTHQLGGFKRNARVELRIIPGDAARTTIRIESVRINRVFRFTNNSINGADAVGYYTNLLPAALQDGDSYAVLGMGSNDRLLAAGSYGGVPTGTVSTYEDYTGRIIADHLVPRGITPILLTDPAARNEDSAVYKFKMLDARAALMSVAERYGCDMIDEYARTAVLVDAGDYSELADSVHPNDLGHMNRFLAIAREIEGASAR